MWLERLTELTPDATFAPPAADDAIRACEQALGRRLPDDLVGLLRETNGVEGEFGLGLVWPVERIIRENVLFRTGRDYVDLYMPFDPLVFFADAGNGDQFAFVLPEGREDVFAWNHEDDSRSWVAPDLARYLKWWLDGTVKL